MKKFNKEEIFKNQINKKEDKTTISKKFKEDIIDFFYKNKNISTKRILEIGCYAGYTTRIFSYIFDEVIAFDNREKVLKIAREFNKDRKNIKFQNFSSYNKKGWNFPICDVFFIDCMHEYNKVKSDINNCIKNNPNGIIIFDDYGLIKSVKKAVDKFIEEKKIEVIKKIGEEKGTKFKGTRDKILKDYEGIICKIRNI